MARVTIGSGASTTIAGEKSVRQTVLIKNMTATASVYLELDGAAAAATSYEWEATDGPLSFELSPTEVLKGRSAGADQTIHVLGTPD